MGKGRHAKKGGRHRCPKNGSCQKVSCIFAKLVKAAEVTIHKDLGGAPGELFVARNVSGWCLSCGSGIVLLRRSGFTGKSVNILKFCMKCGEVSCQQVADDEIPTITNLHEFLRNLAAQSKVGRKYLARKLREAREKMREAEEAAADRRADVFRLEALLERAKPRREQMQNVDQPYR